MKFFSTLKNTIKNMFGEAYQGTDKAVNDAIKNIVYQKGAVSPDQAMRQATVYACVTLIADNVAQLPLHLYEKTDGDNKPARNKAVKHPVYKLLRQKPNSWQTPFEFYQFLLHSLLLYGMACCYKNRVGGKLMGLEPIPPENISEVWEGNKRHFSVYLENGVKNFHTDDIFCVKAMTLNGRTAVSPITYAARNIDMSLDAGDYASSFYKNGARPSGILTTAQSLSSETSEKMKENWKKAHGGGNSGGTAVLWGGMEYKAISMSNQDAQLLELLGFQRTEIAAIYRVPPHMVGAVDKTSSWGTGIEEQKQSFLTFTLQPWLTRIEQAVARDLLSDGESGNFYAEFLTDKFLQSNQRDRSDSYKTALGGTQHPGWLTVNEIRQKENMRPLKGGDKLYSPVSPVDSGSGQSEAFINE